MAPWLLSIYLLPSRFTWSYWNYWFLFCVSQFHRDLRWDEVTSIPFPGIQADQDLLPSEILKWILFSVLKYATPQRLQMTHSKYSSILLPLQALGNGKDSTPYSLFPSMFSQWPLRPHSCGFTREDLEVFNSAFIYSISLSLSHLQFLFMILLETALLSFGERKTSFMTTKKLKKRLSSLIWTSSKAGYLLSPTQFSSKPSGEMLTANSFKLSFEPWPWYWDNRKHPTLHSVILVSYFGTYCLYSPNSSRYSSHPMLVQTEVVSHQFPRLMD